jgi:hypothetical protein
MNASHHLILFLSLVLTLSANASNSMPKMQTPAAIDAKSSENSMSTPDLKNTPLTFEQISKHYIKNPMMVSEARLKVLFWKIYDAKLAAPDGSWKKDTPFAREIGYDDEALLSKWYEQMREIFPNVKEGENITGVFDKNQHSHFFYQGKLIGTIEDKVFGQSFFGIWLHEKTSEPDMRKQLLGLK